MEENSSRAAECLKQALNLNFCKDINGEQLQLGVSMQPGCIANSRMKNCSFLYGPNFTRKGEACILILMHVAIFLLPNVMMLLLLYRKGA